MSFEDKTQAFVEFLQAKQIRLSPKVEIADFRAAGQGRGMRAREAIAAGETLFSIPAASILRIESDPELAALAAKHDLDAWSALIVRMMAVQDTPEWRPYFDVLPTTFNTPMFWDAEESRRLLQGSALVDKIGRDSADELYDLLASTILQEERFRALPAEATSRAAFHRMGSLIMSYAFDVPRGDAAGATAGQGHADSDSDSESEAEEDGKAMVPPADILNSHTKLQNARLTVPEGNGDFEMVASRDIEQGAQIYNIYGNQPSSDMLRRYGFVEVGGTGFEAVEISRELVLEVAQQTLGETGLAVRNDTFSEAIGDLDSFEIGLSAEDEGDGEPTPELEIEPELLMLANCLAAPELKRRHVREVVALSESERLLCPAQQLLLAVVARRRELYGSPPVLDPASAPPSRVWLSKEDMSAQVRQAELAVLDMAADWLQSADTVDTLSTKKQKR